uniref:Nanos-type domain-containing protein n=1 Tax=Parastrongyloides trichosuri TaxID=131310 RepID=A0A0N4ZWD9_PARTI
MCFTKASSKNESKLPIKKNLHDPVAIKHYNEHNSPSSCETCFNIEKYTAELEVANYRSNSINHDPFLGDDTNMGTNLYDLPIEDLLNYAGRMPWDNDLTKNPIIELIINEYIKHLRKHTTFCTFCFNRARKECEKEGKLFIPSTQYGQWIGHKIKNARGIVTCPYLRTMSCANCGATGDNAHTKKHCPHPELIMKN